MTAVPPFVLVHRECGYPAFYLDEMPVPNSTLSSRIARHLDGSPIPFNSFTECDTCGGTVIPHTRDVFPMVLS